MKSTGQCGTAIALERAWFEDTRQDALDRLMQLMHRVARHHVIQI
jgi:hypothetical protein